MAPHRATPIFNFNLIIYRSLHEAYNRQENRCAKEIRKLPKSVRKTVNIIHQLLEEYDISSTADIQDALKDLLGGTIKEMLDSEMEEHLGYSRSERSDSDDYHNG